MVYKALNDLAPHYIADMFHFTNDVHHHSLRSTARNDLFLEGGSTQYHMNTFSYVAAKDWNELPIECRNANSVTSFKRLIKLFY